MLLGSIFNIHKLRFFWLIMVLGALFLELTALFFQHIQGLRPCVMCIYQRVALWGIFLSGIFLLIFCKTYYLRILALITGIYSSSWALYFAIEHNNYLLDTRPWKQCLAKVELFDYLPLDTLFPALFKVTGVCGEVDWRFLGLTMPGTLIPIFFGFLVVFSIALVLSLFRK